jgi:acetylornithine/succinyldiaminopimelate/putrescine aminotransferase
MLRLAGLLSDRFGGAQAFFCNSGAEANEAALKVARKATGRARIVALEGGFHGRTLGALSETGQPAKWEGFGPLVPGFAFARPNDVESLEAAVAPGGELAAIMLEPVLGEGGVVPLDDAFVAAAAEIAREVGALLVLDEVQAGLGRTGTFFAYEQLGLEPDLVTLAKGLGNGLPIGALLVREGVADAIGPGDHGSTFGGNPVACAAACAVVETIDAALFARGEQLAAGLAALPAVRDVRGRGLLLAAVLDREAGAVVDAARELGLLVLTAGPDVLRLLPPLPVTEAEVGEALDLLARALG